MALRWMILFILAALVLDFVLPQGQGSLSLSSTSGDFGSRNELAAANDVAPAPMPYPAKMRAEQARQEEQQRSATPTSWTAASLKKLMKAIHSGAGVKAGKNMCYHAVKNILEAAGLVTSKQRWGKLTGGAAYDAMHDLPSVGFVNKFPDQKACTTPGTIRIYKGESQGKTKAQAEAYVMKHFRVHATAGDRYGHSEIVTSEGYCHFALPCSKTPMNGSHHFGPKRRILEGCFVKP